jgi:hypothetical protein
MAFVAFRQSDIWKCHGLTTALRRSRGLVQAARLPASIDGSARRRDQWRAPAARRRRLGSAELTALVNLQPHYRTFNDLIGLSKTAGGAPRRATILWFIFKRFLWIRTDADGPDGPTCG